MASFGKGDVVIIGAGLVGSLLAYLLQKKGFRVSVFERYQDIRQIPSLGRSINLVITKRGLRAVDCFGEEGLRDEILALAVAVTGRVIHQQDGSVQFQRYGKDDSECNYSISRFELNKFLIQKAESAGAKIYFGHSLDSDSTDFSDGTCNGGGDVGCTLEFVAHRDGIESRVRVFCACPVVGCDGGGSRARYAMRNAGLTEFKETMLGTDNGGSRHVYKEMLFPQGTGLVQHGLHIWPRRNHMLMALANLDGSMTGTLYMDEEGSESFATITDAEAGQEFFEKYYPDAIPLLGGIDRANDQMLTNPSGILGTVLTSKWNHKGRIVLIGDAAHAIVPFFGQGMNSGFEDVLELIRALDRHGCSGGCLSEVVDVEAANNLTTPPVMDSDVAASWANAFEEFNAARKPNGDAIATLAVENFHEVCCYCLIFTCVSYFLILYLDAGQSGRQEFYSSETR
mmetsp:Transcript_21348/g.30907  ORF Transcript_21348/g.30907 Transcript_21348/m.30907 type:complete len:455 (-) Transcript_21348:652-2016(-)